MRRYNGTPRVDTSVINNTIGNGTNSLDDIFAWAGPLQMGEINTPILVQSETEFRQTFGSDVNDFAKVCIRALRGGVKLLISRLAHYNAGVLTGSKAENSVFEAKSVGAYGNTLKVSTSVGRVANTVNISVILQGVSSETYVISATPTIQDIELANASLRFVNLKSSAIGQALSSTLNVTLTGGVDTDALTADDYIGNQLDQTGLYSFDKVMGIKFLSCPDVALNSADRAIVDYATMRNVIALLRAPVGVTGEMAVKYRNCEAPYSGTAIDNCWAFGFMGGTKVSDNGSVKTLCELADVAIAISKKNKYGSISDAFSVQPYSFVEDAVGVGYNLAVSSRQTESDKVFDAGLNAIIQDDTNRIMIWGDFTLQKDFTALSFTGNVELLQDMIFKIKPVLKSYIAKSNTIPTWRLMYQEVKRILDRYKTANNIYDYKYFGDQNIDKIEQIKVNKIDDVNAGIYKLIIEIQFNPTMRYISLELTASMQGISFTVLN